MSINLSIGCSFSNKHVDAILDLVEFQKNSRSEIKIASVYGSPGKLNPFGSARPRYREHNSSFTEFENNCKRLKSVGISINLTLNSMCVGHNKGRYSMLSGSSLLSLFNLMNNTIDCVIVAHPGVIDKIHDLNISTPIIVSTVMNVHQLSQLEFIKDKWPKVIKVCTALWRNRDMEWLKQANSIIPIELLSNEFCSIGGTECEGLYRQACYMNHSTDGNNWNPMDVCRKSRQDNPSAWLKAKFILPDWLHIYYKETGINQFKITGRTHPAEFIKKIGKMYIEGKGIGNLLELWGQLEATYKNIDQKSEQDKALSNYPYISIYRLASRKFFMNPICNSSNCNYLCKHCDRLYSKLIL